jgi:hypothetical protein
MTKPETIERREKRQRAAEVRCPVCAGEPPVPLVRNIAICRCLASLVLEEGVWRRARGADTTVLSDQELARLRTARKTLREAV